jgi:hypothetical protein
MPRAQAVGKLAFLFGVHDCDSRANRLEKAKPVHGMEKKIFPEMFRGNPDTPKDFPKIGSLPKIKLWPANDFGPNRHKVL